MIEDPLVFVEGMEQMAALIDAETRQRLIENAPRYLREQQRSYNPHDPQLEPELYSEFRWNYWLGYGTFLVYETAVGASAAKAAKSTSAYQSVNAKALSQAGRLKKTLAASRFVGTTAQYGYHVAGRASRLGLTDAAQRLRKYPAAKKQQITDGLRRIGRSKVDSLGNYHDELVAFLARSGDDGARLIADGGGNLFKRARDIDKTLPRGLAKADRFGMNLGRLERVVDDLEEIEGLKGLNRLIDDFANAGNIKNARGAAFEARIAARNGADNIAEIQKRITTPKGGTEIDILRKNGKIIEVKRGGRLVNADPKDTPYKNLANKISKLKEYKKEQNIGEKIEVTTKFEPSDEVKDLLSKKNIRLKVVG